MTRLTRNRATGSLLLLVYALSTVAAGLFHDHSHAGSRPCVGHQACHSGDGHDDCDDHCVHDGCAHDGCVHDGGEHEHGSALAAAGHHDPAPAFTAQRSEQLGDDACVVCRFLGLSSFPVMLPLLPPSSELVAAVRVIEPRRSALPLELTLHSRAPPQGV